MIFMRGVITNEAEEKGEGRLNNPIDLLSRDI